MRPRPVEPAQRVIYLLHFSVPVGGAQHYLGIARVDQLPRRLHAHAAGYGAYLTRRAIDAGARLALVRTWQGATFALERSMKRRSHLPRLCPICSGRAVVDAATMTTLWLPKTKQAVPRGNGLSWGSSSKRHNSHR